MLLDMSWPQCAALQRIAEESVGRDQQGEDARHQTAVVERVQMSTIRQPFLTQELALWKGKPGRFVLEIER